MQTASFEEVLEQILARDQRYQRDAYFFVRDALEYTRKMLEREGRSRSEKTAPIGDREGKTRLELEQQHVTPQELLAGLRELALEQFGPMAITVLEEWGIHACHDFGELVFIMIEHKALKKTDKDTRTDFDNGYDFYEAFRKPYLPAAKIAENPNQPKPAKA
jgi:uncharacterized repeat protein (TIGR04138 family)